MKLSGRSVIHLRFTIKLQDIVGYSIDCTVAIIDGCQILVGDKMYYVIYERPLISTVFVLYISPHPVIHPIPSHPIHPSIYLQHQGATSICVDVLFTVSNPTSLSFPSVGHR